MAKIHPNGLISGKMGDKTYFIVNGKQFVKSSTLRSKKSMIRNPNYDRFFEQGKLTGLASKRSSLLRAAFFHEFNGNTDSQCHNRLISVFIQLAKILPGDSPVASDFNSKLHLPEAQYLLNGLVLNTHYRNVFNEESGFDPEEKRFTLRGLGLQVEQTDFRSTHLQIQFAIARVDFEHFSFDTVRAETDLMRLDTPPSSVTLQINRLPEGTGVLFYAYLVKHMAFDGNCVIPNFNSRFNTMRLCFLKD